MRCDFDNYLLELSRDAGINLRLGVCLENIDRKHDRITLSDGTIIHYMCLIGADGVNSQVAKQLFGSSFDRRTIDFGLEVEVPRDRLAHQQDIVEIDFGAAKWGYGWVFPKQ